ALADGEGGIRGRGDGAGGVDAGDVRVAGRDLVLSGGGEGVLEVQRRVLDRDGDLARRKRLQRDVLDLSPGPGRGGPGHERANPCTHRADSSTAPCSEQCCGALLRATGSRWQKWQRLALADPLLGAMLRSNAAEHCSEQGSGPAGQGDEG